jgi:[ribosomal protein S5]-alanine N-acetyltransferase
VRRLLRREPAPEVLPRPVATRPGGRVELRDLVLADRDAFLEMVRESRDLHRPWTYPPERADQFEDLVSRTSRDDFKCLAAVLADGGDLVGIFTVSQIVRGYFQSAYLGYYANARHAGKGLMSEAMRLVLDHAFGPLSLHRLEANIQPGNAPSIALARGAKSTGAS